MVFLSLTGCDYINDDDIRNALFPQLCYILLILHGIHGLVYLQKIPHVIYVKLDKPNNSYFCDISKKIQ